MEGDFALELLSQDPIVHLANLLLREGLLEVWKLHALLDEGLLRVLEHHRNVRIMQVGVQIHENDREVPDCVWLPILDLLIVLVLFQVHLFEDANDPGDLLALLRQPRLVQDEAPA